MLRAQATEARGAGPTPDEEFTADLTGGDAAAFAAGGGHDMIERPRF
jgi:hypothetical protein